MSINQGEKREYLLHSDIEAAGEGYKKIDSTFAEPDEEDIHADKKFLCLRGARAHYVYVGVLIAIWWGLCIGYNVYNKFTLKACRLPWLLGVMQMAFGIPVNGVYWLTGIRKAPKLSLREVGRLTPIAFFHMGTHMSAVFGLAVGAVSFVQIIKTFEPVLTAIFTGLLLGKFFSWQVYITLIPIIGGVAYSSMKGDIGFDMVAFICAMGSNTFAALRGVTSKKVMGAGNAFEPEQNMGPVNLFAVLTFLSTAMLLPISIVMEYNVAADVWNNRDPDTTSTAIILYAFASGFFYYFYNEVAFVVLDNVNPVTHAVTNTLKRVAIIASAIFIFNTPMSLQGYIGSTVAILGTMLYAMSTKKFKTTYKMACIPIDGK